MIIYVGSDYPILHDYNDYLYEVRLFGKATDYVGAYWSPEPSPDQLVAPPGGFAHIKAAKTDTVDFIIDTIHQFPHEVTIYDTNALGYFIHPEFATDGSLRH